MTDLKNNESTYSMLGFIFSQADYVSRQSFTRSKYCNSISGSEGDYCLLTINQSTKENGWTELRVENSESCATNIVWENNAGVAGSGITLTVRPLQGEEADYYKVRCNNNKCSGGIGLFGPNVPDAGNPCRGLDKDFSRTYSKDDLVLLEMGNCPGTVRWYEDPLRKYLITTLTKTGKKTHTVGKLNATTLYYFDCQLQDGTICQSVGTAKIRESGRQVNNITSRTALEAVDQQCNSAILLSVAMAYEYEELIRQLLEVAKGDDGELSQTEAEKLVTQIKSAAENAYPDYNLVFPVDDSPIVDEIMNGNYDIAGRLLAAPNTGLVEGDKFEEDKKEGHGEVLYGVLGVLGSPLDMPLNSLESISNNHYDLIGETGMLTIGGLPSGECEEYSSTQKYAFCSNDQPDVDKAMKLGLLDEIGKENIISLIKSAESVHWLKFMAPFKAYGITEISDNFKNGASKTLELTQKVYQDNLKISYNFKLFEKKIIDLIWPKVESSRINEISQIFIKDNIDFDSPNLAESIWKFVPATIYVAMGGTQQTDFKVKVYRLKGLRPIDFNKIQYYAFHVEYLVWDSFGMDWDDVNGWKLEKEKKIFNNKGRDAKFAPLRSAFMLQHYHSYHPFFTYIKYVHGFRLLK